MKIFLNSFSEDIVRLFREPLDEEVQVRVNVSQNGVVALDPLTIDVPAQNIGPWKVSLTGLSGGHVPVFATIIPNITR